MTTDRTDILWGRGWDAATYHGFSGAPPSMRPPPPVGRAWRTPRAVTVAGGVAAALALGLALGFLTRPHLAQPTSPAPMRAVTPSAATMDIQVNAPAPPAAVKSAGKLEVLPPDLARSAPRPVQAYAAPLGPSSLRPADGGATAPQFAAADPCAGLRGRAAQMVCADPDLAAADRELNQAYRRALRSGIPTEQLRNDQRDWLAIREDAARRSPRAVADVYEQRIDELNRIADEDGPG